MNRYSQQGVLVKEDNNHTQGLSFQVLPSDFKFHIGILARVMNHFLSPVENIKNVDYIYFPSLHLLFTVFCESYSVPSFLGNPPNPFFDFLYINYHHSLTENQERKLT
jgi:hypothetical protein